MDENFDFDMVDDFLDFDDIDKEMEDAMNYNADERAGFNDYYDIDEDVEELNRKQGESSSTDEKDRRKPSALAHAISEGFEREKISFLQHPFKWIADKIYGVAVFAATLVGDVVRSAVFGYSRPFDFQNLKEAQDEKDALKNAKKENDEQRMENDDKDTQEQDKESMQDIEKKVQNAEQDQENQQNIQNKNVIEQAGPIMKAFGFSALYSEETTSMHFFMDHGKEVIDMKSDDYTSQIFSNNITDSIKQALDNHDKNEISSTDGAVNAVMYEIPSVDNAVKAVMCSSALIANYTEIRDKNPFDDEIHGKVLSSVNLPDNCSISAEVDRVFITSGNGAPQVSTTINLIYSDGETSRTFGTIPVDSLYDSTVINKEACDKIFDALHNTIENPDKVFTHTIEKPKVVESNINSEEKYMDDLLRGCDEKAHNDVFINNINKETVDQTISCVGKITDVSIKTTKKGKDMCTFNLEDNNGSIKCVCLPKQYNELKNIINDSPETVRVTAKVTLNTYKGNESIELAPSAIDSVELHHEMNQDSQLSETSHINPMEQVTDEYTVTTDNNENSDQSETIENLEEKIMNGEYSDPVDNTDYEAMAAAIMQQQDEMNEELY